MTCHEVTCATNHRPDAVFHEHSDRRRRSVPAWPAARAPRSSKNRACRFPPPGARTPLMLHSDHRRSRGSWGQSRRGAEPVLSRSESAARQLSECKLLLELITLRDNSIALICHEGISCSVLLPTFNNRKLRGTERRSNVSALQADFSGHLRETETTNVDIDLYVAVHVS